MRDIPSYFLAGDISLKTKLSLTQVNEERKSPISTDTSNYGAISSAESVARDLAFVPLMNDIDVIPTIWPSAFSTESAWGTAPSNATSAPNHACCVSLATVRRQIPHRRQTRYLRRVVSRRRLGLFPGPVDVTRVPRSGSDRRERQSPGPAR